MSTGPERAPGSGSEPACGPAPDADPGAVDAATRGLDAVLGREVAMITLPPASGRDLVVRTEQIRRLAGLHHAHLVEVFDVDGLAEGAESTVVLQSVTGIRLDPAADRARWWPRAVAEIAAQTASALAHAHARGVVHGRIGPASIVVGGTPEAPFAWLTGFTAALHPAPPATGPGDRPPPLPAADVADLARALAPLPDTGSRPASGLESTLADMAAGRTGAREAAEALVRVAESLRRADEDETGVVPLAAARAAAPRPATAGRPGPRAAAPPDGGTPAVTSGFVISGVDPSGADPSGAVSGSERARVCRFRRARLAARGARLAGLGGAVVAIAAASGFVLWAAEGPSGTQHIGSSGPTGPAATGPPVAATPAGASPGDTSGASGASETVVSVERPGDGRATGVDEAARPTPPAITAGVTTRRDPPAGPSPVLPSSAPTGPTTGSATGPTTGSTIGPRSTTHATRGGTTSATREPRAMTLAAP